MTWKMAMLLFLKTKKKRSLKKYVSLKWLIDCAYTPGIFFETCEGYYFLKSYVIIMPKLVDADMRS